MQRTLQSLFFTLLACLLAAPALATAPATEELVSGVIEGRRPATLTCHLVNKSGETLDDITVTLKRPDGSFLAGPFILSGVGPGSNFSLGHTIQFPALDEAAYCHATIPFGKFLRGSLRLVNNLDHTIADSDLLSDTMGRLGYVKQVMMESCAGSCDLWDPATVDMASSFLEARRNATFTCNIINKSGGDLDDVEIALKNDAGDTLESDECDGVPNGASCTVSRQVVFPAFIERVFCHATVPEGAFVRGNLRLEDAQSATTAESDLKPDMDAMVRYLGWMAKDIGD